MGNKGINTVTILRNNIRKARKQYLCDWCYCSIFPGDSYQYLFGGKEIWGKMIVLRYCMECKTDRSMLCI
jgi:hypothetical protein